VQRESYDDRLRAAAIQYVRDLESKNGGLISQQELDEFTFEGNRISLLQHMRGIRVISGLEAALTIRTTYRLRPEDRPYEDDIGADGYPRYKWRGTDPDAYDNRALRQAMILGKPLIWFVAGAPGVFRAINPVWLVEEEPDYQQFVVAPEADLRAQWGHEFGHPADEALQRQYVDEVVRRRLHQPLFRLRVLEAYARRCAVCRLRHPELLDAAHIREDSEGGEPIVPNGVAMCAIHHRAYDNAVVGIRPDYVVEVRKDVLEEIDGPTLLHALQGLHAERITLPVQESAWPRRDLLEERYERFRAVS
jgi:putative restriction endonuclease